VPALTLAHPNFDRLVGTAFICAVVGLLLALGTDWLIRWGVRDAVPLLDAKIAEARRMRAIERGLRELPAKGKGKGKAAKVRVAVEDEAAEDEAAEDEAAEEQAPRARRRR
jgi:hypothetical protein